MDLPFKAEHPIIMAPMFLVSNEAMMIAADGAGIASCIPALNFRRSDELGACLARLHQCCQNSFGVNLIVNKSNLYFEEQLKVCAQQKVPFVITSLGSPEKTIKTLKPLGTKVFCDVTDLHYAKKVEALGADAVIAVNSGAGGHAGKIPANILVPMLAKALKIPVISAGGVGDKKGVDQTLSLGAAALSIGSPFIATNESPVSDDYKDACVNHGAGDIVMTEKISGTPCTVINTDYVKKIGTEQNLFEKLLNQNKQLKKWTKALTFYRGMRAVRKAAFSATYKSVWCAGPSIEYTRKVEGVADVVARLTKENS